MVDIPLIFFLPRLAFSYLFCWLYVQPRSLNHNRICDRKCHSIKTILVNLIFSKASLLKVTLENFSNNLWPQLSWILARGGWLKFLHWKECQFSELLYKLLNKSRWSIFWIEKKHTTKGDKNEIKDVLLSIIKCSRPPSYLSRFLESILSIGFLMGKNRRKRVTKNIPRIWEKKVH